METAFQRENHRSFLMIREPEDEGRTQYPYRMILRNRIPGLLCCTEHFTEGSAWLCYDISGKQPVKTFYERQTLNAAQMQRFLKAVEQAFTACGNFLLDDRYLYLDPRFIYWDAASEEYGFVYYPGEKEKEDGFRRLADFFLDCASIQEERSVYFAYQFYQQTKKDFFSLSAFLDSGAEKRDRTECKEEETNFGTMAGGWTDTDLGPEEMTEREHPFQNRKERKREQEGKKNEKDEKYGVIKKKAAGGEPEKRGFLGFWLKLWNSKGGKTRENVEDAYARQIWETYDDGPQEAKAIWEQEEKERPEVTIFMGNRGRNPQDGGIQHRLIKMTGSMQTGQEYRLEKFPVLVGKIKGQTELLLEEPTVSRMHARLFLKEEKITLMDLNSTNGTFVNGLRLEPEEQMPLESEDEISFGEAKYLFI